jgi:hypothetical protein
MTIPSSHPARAALFLSLSIYVHSFGSRISSVFSPPRCAPGAGCTGPLATRIPISRIMRRSISGSAELMLTHLQLKAFGMLLGLRVDFRTCKVSNIKTNFHLETLWQRTKTSFRRKGFLHVLVTQRLIVMQPRPF